MDKIINEDFLKIKNIAGTPQDTPLLMINQNKYIKDEYPNGNLYKNWKKINLKMLSNVKGKILWNLDVKGQTLINGYFQSLDEILAYWYPSHSSFLKLLDDPLRLESFDIRKKIISYSIIHRCDGINPPLIK